MIPSGRRWMRLRQGVAIWEAEPDPPTRARCDYVEIADDGTARRCVLWMGHQQHGQRRPSLDCEFRDDVDQEVCGTRLTDWERKRVRTCVMTRGHAGNCIYLSLTERDATEHELYRPWEV